MTSVLPNLVDIMAAAGSLENSPLPFKRSGKTPGASTLAVNTTHHRINGLSQTRKSSAFSWAKSFAPSSAIHSRSISLSRS